MPETNNEKKLIGTGKYEKFYDCVESGGKNGSAVGQESFLEDIESEATRSPIRK